eukprot:5054988-Amphidinium_carterae.1
MSVLRVSEVRRLPAADPISPSSPIRGTFDQLSETGLNTQAIVGDAIEQARPCACYCEARYPVTPWRERRMGTPEQLAGHLHAALEADPERSRMVPVAEPVTPAVAVAQTCGSLSTVEDAESFLRRIPTITCLSAVCCVAADRGHQRRQCRASPRM